MTAQLEQEIAKKKIKFILNTLGHQFFSKKNILDIGAGCGDVGAAFFKLGGRITALDFNQDYLKLINKKYPTVRILKKDLNTDSIGQYYNIIFNLDTLSYLKNYENNLIDCCKSCETLILETCVFDNQSDANLLDNPVPQSKIIENILLENNMNWIRVDSSTLNYDKNIYDWKDNDAINFDLSLRRIWIASKNENLISSISTTINNKTNTVCSLVKTKDIYKKIDLTNKNIQDGKMSSLFHQELAKKKIKFILNLFNHKYFINKSILDAGSGNGDIGAALFRLGASVTASDFRQENLLNISKKYPAIKTVKSNFELPLNINSKFDITLSIGTLCHISNYEQHLRDLCARSKDLILETAVCDSDDPSASFLVQEDKSINGLSCSGAGSRPSAAKIEKILSESGMLFTRLDVSELNYENYQYDWKIINSNNREIFLRRFWICSRNPHVINEISKKFRKPIINVDLKENQVTVENINKNFSATFLNSYKKDDANEQTASNHFISDKKFVIVIPSYKNEKWAEKNILSALNQNYSKFRILFVDDCSPDNTFKIVQSIVENHPNKNKATISKNNARCGAMENLYNMIVSCNDDEIILTLDGDDWLAHENVLSKLNEVYQGDVWMTYGQYKNYPEGRGHCQQIPSSVIKSNNFRQSAWLSSHLRTFYAWLFKKINKEDLLYEGKFAPSAWDMYIMFPMLEMSGTKSRFIEEVLYIYNLDNPINDHKVDRGLQARLDKTCRSKKKYSPLPKSPPLKLEKIKIGLLLIATGKYDIFIPQLIESADKLFFNDQNFEVKYFIFTDSNVALNTGRDYEIINIEHKPFPYASMNRFKHFTQNAEKLSNVDYLYYIDVDCRFVDKVSSEILGNLVGVRHCGYFNGGGTFETNTNSVFYVDIKKYKYYFGGGFSGGKTKNYLNLSKKCYELIEKDLSNNIIPRFHDETAINFYFLNNPPDVTLSPSYHYPESNLEYYMNRWKPNKFEPKILLLDKNHKEIRK